jgi:hypothetical protein
VISPLGPNEKIIAIAVVKGGDTSGSRTAASTTVRSHRGSCARAAVKAKTNPIAVPMNPTSVASQRLFQKARTLFLSAITAASPESVIPPCPSDSTRAIIIPSG